MNCKDCKDIKSVDYKISLPQNFDFLEEEKLSEEENGKVVLDGGKIPIIKLLNMVAKKLEKLDEKINENNEENEKNQVEFEENENYSEEND